MIREARNSDISQLVKWMNSMIDHIYSSSKEIYLKEIDDDFFEKQEEGFKNVLESKDAKVFILEENNHLLGYIFGTIISPYFHASRIKRIGQIEHCWVEKDYREKGLATELVKELENWFRNENIKHIDVSYGIGNVEAEHVWKKLGYSPYRTHSTKILT